MISLIFWCLAAACCAVMDTLQHHFDSSVFFPSLKNSKRVYWWNPFLSWRNKYINQNPEKGLRKWLWFDVPFTDGWHTFKSLMIVFICISVATFEPLIDSPIINIIIYGTAWNVIFNLFYNKILIKKK